MEGHGSLEQAADLAASRWAQSNDFDLEPAEWQRLFRQFGVGITLEAIKHTKEYRSPRPEVRYQLFLETCTRLSDRYRQ